MKLIFNGAEYYLSNYLNCLKIPMVLFIIWIVICCAWQMNDFPPKKFEETFLGKHLRLYLFLCFVFGAYMFLVWN